MNNHRIVAPLLLLGAVLAGCSDAAGPGDPCLASAWELNVAISVSADSQPLISWEPADCGMSIVAVYRFVAGQDCFPMLFGETCIPRSYRLWRVGSMPDAYPWVARGPAAILPPLRFGDTPESAYNHIPAGAAGVGDTVWVEVSRHLEGQDIARAATRLFVLGTGVQP